MSHWRSRSDVTAHLSFLSFILATVQYKSEEEDTVQFNLKTSKLPNQYNHRQSLNSLLPNLVSVDSYSFLPPYNFILVD